MPRTAYMNIVIRQNNRLGNLICRSKARIDKFDMNKLVRGILCKHSQWTKRKNADDMD